MKTAEYKELCAKIHRKYGLKLGLPYWESCALAGLIECGEVTEEKLFENLTETVEENQ
jgi:hypothetical protein